MNYLLNRDSDDFKTRVCRMNDIDISKLDVSEFEVDRNIEIVNSFIEKLLSFRDKRFFIVGDYDCDGICATAIMKKLFEDLNISSNYYIPSRFKEGYGVNNNIVDIAYNNGFDAILMVDNGAVAYEQINYANSLGLLTFVIDHHEYSDVPECSGFIHPNLFEEKYSDMCAAGLCCLISTTVRYDDETEVLGGLATLADMVTVLNYNRYLLKKMIALLRNGVCYPILNLLGKNEIGYQSLSFNVIPKINAVSRLDEIMNVNYVVRYLLNNDGKGLDYYTKIELINTKRKELTQIQTAIAYRKINYEDDVIVICSDEFKEGLCGLIANKIMYDVNKPVLVLSLSDGLLKGSGRCPTGVNIYEYLYSTKDIFETLGGHAQAVGLSIRLERLDELKEYIRIHEFKVPDSAKEALLLGQSDIDAELLEKYEEMAPYGTGFKEPLFAIGNLSIEKRIIISGKYPKYILNKDTSAISFNSNHINAVFNTIIGKLSKDTYRKNAISILIEDLI